MKTNALSLVSGLLALSLSACSTLGSSSREVVHVVEASGGA